MIHQSVLASSALLAFLASGNATRVSLDGGLLKQDANAAFVLEGDRRYTGPMAAKICGGEDTDIDWELVVHSDGSCLCQCDAAECMRITCLEEGYDLEENQDELPVCVRVETEGGEVLPDILQEVNCAPGVLNTKGSSAECVMPAECPPPPHLGGDAIGLAEQVGCEGCRYPVQCVHPATLVVHGGKAFCKLKGKTTKIKTNRLEMPAQRSCPDDESPIEGICPKTLDQCPGIVVVPPEAMACGPKTDKYIEMMLQSIAAEQAELGKANVKPTRTLLTCVASCHAIFAKFTECAGQSAQVCVGRAASSGRAIRQIDEFAISDSNAQWLKLNRRKFGATKGLPCKDMYGSEYNFKNGWQQGVEKLESFAVKNYLLLQGEYVRRPTGSLDCRKGGCRRVDHYAAHQPPKNDRSVGQCLEQCKHQYR